MKNLQSIIQEKLRLGKDTNFRAKSSFTDEELRKDYEDVEHALTKAEKQVYAEKYGIFSNKFRDIQLEILDLLRQNRQSKKTFDAADVLDFIRFDIKERDYLDYLDKEPIEFIKRLVEYYQFVLNKYNVNLRTYSLSSLSSAARFALKKYNQLRSYLITKGAL